MVSIGSIAVGVEMTGVEEAIKQVEDLQEETEELVESTEGLGDGLDSATDGLSDVSNESEGASSSLGSLIGWLGLGRLSAGRMGGAASKAGGAIRGIGAAARTAGALLGGYLLTGITGVVGAIGSLVAGVSASTALMVGGIIAVVAAVALLASEILGLTDYTRISEQYVRDLAKATESYLQGVWRQFENMFPRVASIMERLYKWHLNTYFGPLQRDWAQMLDNVVQDHRQEIKRIQSIINSVDYGPLGPAGSLTTISGEVTSRFVEEGADSSDMSSSSTSTSEQARNAVQKTVEIGTMQFNLSGEFNPSDMTEREKRQWAEDISEKIEESFTSRL